MVWCFISTMSIELIYSLRVWSRERGRHGDRLSKKARVEAAWKTRCHSQRMSPVLV